MKIFCVGRNYVAHAKELGNEVPDEPVIFMKPKVLFFSLILHFIIPSSLMNCIMNVNWCSGSQKTGNTSRINLRPNIITGSVWALILRQGISRTT
jgi:hypothetical protein